MASRRALCAVVPLRRGEEARRELAELLDPSLAIRRSGGSLYMPLLRRPERRLSGVEVRRASFDPAEDHRSLSRRLGFQPSYETIGDLCVLSPEQRLTAAQARAILETHRGVRVVLRPTSAVEGARRVRSFRHVAGERRTETLHRENGCVFAVDVARVYFSPRLATERARVAALVRPGEVALDMFTGAGCFAIQMAKRAARVVAVDNNPDAIRYLRRNIELNRLSNVEPRRGDVRRVVPWLEPADRVVMNFPTGAVRFLGAALKAAKRGATIHLYDICNRDAVEQRAAEVVARSGGRVALRSVRVVRPYAPYIDNIVMELEVKDEG